MESENELSQLMRITNEVRDCDMEGPGLRFYAVKWDEDTRLIFPKDENGLIPSYEQAQAIIEGWLKFYHFIPPTLLELINSDTEIKKVKEEQEYARRKEAYEQRMQENHLARRNAPRLNPGVVYLIRAENGYYKIGRTKDLETRLKALTKNSPFKLEVVHTIAVDDTVIFERELHETFSAKRREGEWFLLEDSDIEIIKSLGEPSNDIDDIPF